MTTAGDAAGVLAPGCPVRALGFALAGIHGILVHAISDEAKRFYEERDFEVSPVAEMTMMITLKDAAANLE